MAVSRYSLAPRIALGTQQGTSEAVMRIRAAMRAGAFQTTQLIVRGAERLDTIAGVLYGDGRYWWILAATSDIGWGLQVPPGTILNVPDLNTVLRYVSG